MRRLSATISRVPRRAALRMRLPIRGCCSVVLEPMTKTRSVWSKQATELVIAPEPKVSASPTTVEEWQSRAQ